MRKSALKQSATTVESKYPITPPAKHREKEHIERDIKYGVEKPLHSVERGVALGTDELRTESVDAGG